MSGIDFKASRRIALLSSILLQTSSSSSQVTAKIVVTFKPVSTLFLLGKLLLAYF